MGLMKNTIMESLQLPFTILDVFTDTAFAGNPLAVVHVPAGARAELTQQIKQRIAREFNLSETVFLHGDEDVSAVSREIDIFTTSEELPFAGHPTIGAASFVLKVLRWHHVETLVTKAGPIKITPTGAQKIMAQIPHEVHIHRNTLRDLLQGTAFDADVPPLIRAGLSDDPAIREAELSAPAVSIVKGMTFLLVELPSLEHLARVNIRNRLDFEAVSNLLLDKGAWASSFVARYYYVPQFTTDTAVWKGQTRMIELDFEDPATGSAACALASYLTLSGKSAAAAESTTVEFDIVQGVQIGRRSEISVEVLTDAADGAGAKIKRLFLGGAAVAVMNGTINL